MLFIPIYVASLFLPQVHGFAGLILEQVLHILSGQKLLVNLMELAAGLQLMPLSHEL